MYVHEQAVSSCFAADIEVAGTEGDRSSWKRWASVEPEMSTPGCREHVEDARRTMGHKECAGDEQCPCYQQAECAARVENNATGQVYQGEMTAGLKARSCVPRALGRQHHVNHEPESNLCGCHCSHGCSQDVAVNHVDNPAMRKACSAGRACMPVPIAQ